MGEVNITGKREKYLSWNDFFMGSALLSAKRSKDPITQVGACIVDDKNRFVSHGYNGFPRGCHDDKFPWFKGPHADLLKNKHLYVVHAEANAILNSHGTNLTGTKMYTTLFPCNECAKLIIQAGIKEVYFLTDKAKVEFQAAKMMFNHAGVKWTAFKPDEPEIVLKLTDENN